MTPKNPANPVLRIAEPARKTDIHRANRRTSQLVSRAYGVPEYTLDEMRAMLRPNLSKRIFSSRLS